MKIAVFGAGGQVGRALAHISRSYNFEMLLYDRAAVDITKLELINTALIRDKPDLIINAAAYTNVDLAEKNREIAFNINKVGAQNLAVASAASELPLFHISTDYVFSGSSDRAYSEADQPDPISVYGESKAEGERAVLSQNKRHIILRTSWIFSANCKNFLTTMLRLGNQQPTIKVVSDQVSAPTSALSIARILFELARLYQQHSTLTWGIYHYSDAPYSTWIDFADKIFERAFVLGLTDKIVGTTPITTDEYLASARRPINSKLDCAQLESVFGFARTSWIDELDLAIKTIIQNKHD